jgi:hypothetical protein
MAGVGLAGNVCGDSLFQKRSSEGTAISTVEGNWDRRLLVPQPGECAWHGRECLDSANGIVRCLRVVKRFEVR